MIQPLITGESGCAALILFSTQVKWLQDCTNDGGALDQAFQRLRYSQFKTAFTFDNRPLTTRRSETEPVSKVWETADNEPYSYNNPRVVQQDQSVDLLTGGTGGTIFPFVRQKGLEEAIQKLGLELRSQYVISFVQEDTTAGYHNLDVRVLGHEGLRVRSCLTLPA
jgi:hypothetical protein